MRWPSSFRTLVLDTFAGRGGGDRLAARWKRLPLSAHAFGRLLAVEECAADLLVRLRQIGIVSHLAPEHAALLESRAVRQTVRMLALRATQREVLGALRARAVPVTAIKGAAFDCAGLRPLRVCNDLDLMVSPPDVPAALNALQSLGYAIPPGEQLPASFHHLPPLLRNDSVPIELHTRLLLRGRATADDPPAVMGCDDGLRVLAPTDWAWHLLAHDSYHHETAGSARSALDLAALEARYAPEIDWREIARRCRTWPDPVGPLLLSFGRLRGRPPVRVPVTMRWANAALSWSRDYAARVARDDADFVFALHKLAGGLIASPTGWAERRRERHHHVGKSMPSIGRDAARLARVLLTGSREARPG